MGHRAEINNSPILLRFRLKSTATGVIRSFTKHEISTLLGNHQLPSYHSQFHQSFFPFYIFVSITRNRIIASSSRILVSAATLSSSVPSVSVLHCRPYNVFYNRRLHYIYSFLPFVSPSHETHCIIAPARFFLFFIRFPSAPPSFVL